MTGKSAGKSIARRKECAMDIYDRLKDVRMSESDRRVAVSALRNAEWICRLAARTIKWPGALKAVLVSLLLRRSAPSR